jgi:hypothetical protein
MSRYVIWTEDEKLEVFVGFDGGFAAFFLTIADEGTDTDEPDTYRFHNFTHHPRLEMTMGEVESTLERFGLTLPPDLHRQLVADAAQCGIPPDSVLLEASKTSPEPPKQLPADHLKPAARVLRWESAL